MVVDGGTHGIRIGDKVVAKGFNNATYVSNINHETSTVTLSNAATVTLTGKTTTTAGDKVTFLSSAHTTGTQATSGQTTIVVADATNIAIGDRVYGTGIHGSARVTGISGTTVTMSNGTTAAIHGGEINFVDIEGLGVATTLGGAEATGQTELTVAAATNIQVGDIVEQLKRLKIHDNTIIMITSDNGPTYAGGVDFDFFNSTGLFQNDPKRMKGYAYEGGVRVPMIVSWPEKIKSGRVINDISISYDIFPTICKAAGIDDINDIDGIFIILPLPARFCCSRRNCNTTLLLLLHPVHCRCTIVHFSNLVRNTCVVQDTLCCCSFTSINVSRNTNVSGES